MTDFVRKNRPQTPDQPSLFLSLHDAFIFKFCDCFLSLVNVLTRSTHSADMFIVMVDTVAIIHTFVCQLGYRDTESHALHSWYVALIPGTWYSELFCHQMGPYQTLRAHTLVIRVC